MAFVFVTVSSSFTCFVVREYICADFFVTEVSIHIRFRSGLHPVSRYLVRFCDVFRVVLHFCLAFPGRPLFPETWYVCVRNGLLRLLLTLLLLALPIPLQRDLGRGPWCRKPFEKYSISVLSSPRRQCSLLVLWRRSWLQMVSFARIATLGPALSSIVLKTTAFWLRFQRVSYWTFAGTV